MASKAETSFSDDSGKTNLKHSEEQDHITRQLCLKSSPTKHDSSEALDKQLVLKRIRHHKCLSKVRSAVQALVSNGSEQANTVSVHQQKWLDHDDVFSSP
ncbi:hypothetical protein Pint_28168 [Pistacia integerrima]|uniref:Uncharacterized protein n=1 Tax=Pistacia integerrima TaxID=434235 RepID=A0ACC0YMY2_9ROSI|nr:hypothetical protein Pint_28168 [Pistacia integerrima]